MFTKKHRRYAKWDRALDDIQAAISEMENWKRGTRGSLSGPTGYVGLSVRTWTCGCGAIHDRDVNAARNTLRFALGMSVERVGDGSSGIATNQDGEVHSSSRMATFQANS